MMKYIRLIVVSVMVLGVVVPALYAQESQSKVPAGEPVNRVRSKADAESRRAAGISTSDKIIGTRNDGRNVYKNSRTGYYVIGDDGSRISLSQAEVQSSVTRKVTDKVVGKTPEGSPIYRGERGVRYYLNTKGEKVVIKKAAQ